MVNVCIEYVRFDKLLTLVLYGYVSDHAFIHVHFQ